jgi:hypothetical protein
VQPKARSIVDFIITTERNRYHCRTAITIHRADIHLINLINTKAPTSISTTKKNSTGMSEMQPNPTREPIAIIGAGNRFPGNANGSSKLWEVLCNPPDLSIPIPESRFNAAGFAHKDPDHHGTTNSTKSYFLKENHKVFDSAFFNINPREAEAIDPQVQSELLILPLIMLNIGFIATISSRGGL